MRIIMFGSPHASAAANASDYSLLKSRAIDSHAHVPLALCRRWPGTIGTSHDRQGHAGASCRGIGIRICAAAFTVAGSGHQTCMGMRVCMRLCNQPDHFFRVSLCLKQTAAAAAGTAIKPAHCLWLGGICRHDTSGSAPRGIGHAHAAQAQPVGHAGHRRQQGAADAPPGKLNTGCLAGMVNSSERGG